jgi:hypothetical protein
MKNWFLAEVTKSEFSIPKTKLDDASFATVLQIIFGLAGGVALIVLMLASLKYVLSRGDPAGVAKAKNAILYALIGLAICAASFSIIGFVVKSV